MIIIFTVLNLPIIIIVYGLLCGPKIAISIS